MLTVRYILRDKQCSSRLLKDKSQKAKTACECIPCKSKVRWSFAECRNIKKCTKQSQINDKFL